MWLLLLLTLGQSPTTATTTTVHAHGFPFHGFRVGDTIFVEAVVVPTTFSFHFRGPHPTGTVDFVMDGSADLGTANVGAFGIARLPTNQIPVGTHTIVATYSGDGNFDTSTSATFTITVSPAITHTRLIPAFRTTVTVNSTVNFTAVVSRGFGFATTPVPDGGVVTFFVDGVAQPTTTTTSGSATFAYTAPATPGFHSVYATYAGDADDNASASPATFVHVVNSIPAHFPGHFPGSFWFFR